MKKQAILLLAFFIAVIYVISRTKRKYWSISLSDKYALDLQVFTKIRSFSDGISVEPITIVLDRYKADHNPQIRVCCVLFNYSIFELEIYNRFHLED